MLGLVVNERIVIAAIVAYVQTCMHFFWNRINAAKPASRTLTVTFHAFHPSRRMGGSRSPIRVGTDVLPGCTRVWLGLSAVLLVLPAIYYNALQSAITHCNKIHMML